MNNKKKILVSILLPLVFILIIFHNWFLSSVVSGGDLNYYYFANFKDFSFYPYAWNWQLQNGSGLGGFSSPFAWINVDYSLPLFIGNIFHINWHAIEIIFYFLPFLILSLVSIIVLYKKLFPHNQFYPLAALIYLLNTYVLMMVGGGQVVGISLAYAIMPLVFLQFINLVDSPINVQLYRKSVIAGILFALLIFFDLRFAYMMVGIVVLYFIFHFKQSWRKIIPIFIIPFGIAGLIHAFWILPVVLSHQNPAAALGGAYSSLQSVQYFSFAKFENSISLLHPNWPENIFGKVYFMRPEFLFIPLFAFASLLFIKTKNKKESEYVLFFALLALIGAFLAKGANDPFGGIYLWMFNHLPGFVMFRDPTKWYTLIALSYSIIIPFTIFSIYECLKNTEKFSINFKNNIFNLQNLFLVIFIFFWLITIRQAIVGQLNGTFRETTVPSEYLSFEQFLLHQKQFSRTFWMPTMQRFGFTSQNHPAISAENFYNVYDEKDLIKELNHQGTETLLQNLGVKYVVVPTDSQKEIFLDNREYSEKLYNQTVTDVSKISWLKPTHQFGNLAVFEVPNPKDHFWFPTQQNSNLREKISYKQVNPVSFIVSVTNADKGDRLVFSDSFDSHWVLISGNFKVDSTNYENLYNSFILSKSGNYYAEVYYEPQKWVNIGVGIGVITLVLSIGSLIILKRKT